MLLKLSIVFEELIDSSDRTYGWLVSLKQPTDDDTKLRYLSHDGTLTNDVDETTVHESMEDCWRALSLHTERQLGLNAA